MWTFCISLRWICFFCCCHPGIPSSSSSSVVLAYFFVVKRSKNNDSLGLQNLRSFEPREIRKFIKCVPAEVLKRGRSVCPSSLFMKPLRMTGKETGNAESRRARRVSVQTQSACRHIARASPAASVDVHPGPCQASYLVFCIINAFVRALTRMRRGRPGWHDLISTEPCLFPAVTRGLPEWCRLEQAQLEGGRLSNRAKHALSQF